MARDRLFFFINLFFLLFHRQFQFRNPYIWQNCVFILIILQEITQVQFFLFLLGLGSLEESNLLLLFLIESEVVFHLLNPRWISLWHNTYPNHFFPCCLLWGFFILFNVFNKAFFFSRFSIRAVIPLFHHRRNVIFWSNYFIWLFAFALCKWFDSRRFINQKTQLR